MTTIDSQQQKLMLKILIGSAWADRRLRAAEVQFLKQMIKHQGLAQDEEVIALLESPVPVEQTERWMTQYLERATEHERQQALVTLAKLFIADEQVADIEHELMDEFNTLMDWIPAQSALEPPSGSKACMKAIGQDSPASSPPPEVPLSAPKAALRTMTQFAQTVMYKLGR